MDTGAGGLERRGGLEVYRGIWKPHNKNNHLLIHLLRLLLAVP